MEREAKKDWSWVDWIRFLFYRQAPLSCNMSLAHSMWTIRRPERPSPVPTKGEVRDDCSSVAVDVA